MEKHYMIYNKKTGEIKGYYITGIWEYDNILKEVNENESLKEITKEVWDALIGNDENIKMNSPKLKLDTIEQFTNATLLNNDLREYFNNYFEETIYEPVQYEPTQQEKDIQFLAGLMQTMIGATTIPSEEGNKKNPALEKIQEIIDRYS